VGKETGNQSKCGSVRKFRLRNPDSVDLGVPVADVATRPLMAMPRFHFGVGLFRSTPEK
jgi:hypothetical protein